MIAVAISHFHSYQSFSAWLMLTYCDSWGGILFLYCWLYWNCANNLAIINSSWLLGNVLIFYNQTVVKSVYREQFPSNFSIIPGNCDKRNAALLLYFIKFEKHFLAFDMSYRMLKRGSLTKNPKLVLQIYQSGAFGKQCEDQMRSMWYICWVYKTTHLEDVTNRSVLSPETVRAKYRI